MRSVISNYRFFLLALVISLCLAISVVPTSEAASLDAENDQIELYYTGTISIGTSIQIFSSGDAECWGYVDCIPGYTAEAAMRLQWLDGDVWRNYHSWYGEGKSVDFYELYPLIKGRTYRVRVIADIFDSDGNWVEIVDAVSGSAKY